MSTQLVNSNLGIRLRDILPDAQLIGATEVYFRSCCGMWKDCQTDDLYVAIMDADLDGHDFTQEAIGLGAAAIVTERLLTTNRPQCVVADSREAYGRICQALAGQPSQRLTTIGVTGTDGKTVTSHLISAIFKAAGQQAGLVSSIEANSGANRQSIPNKELNPPWLAEQLTQMVLAGCQSAVLEVPSVALAKRCLSGVDLDVAVLTNIRESHRNFHGSASNYRRAKMRLLDQLKPTGLAVLNADDPTTHFLLEKIDKPVLTIGIKQEADITATLIQRTSNEQTFVIAAGSDSIPVRTSIIGDQHIYNCLTAMAVGLASGLDLSTIARGLETTGGIPGRLEAVECGQPFGVWVDSARSAGQLAHAIASLRQVTTGNVWCICSIEDGQSKMLRRRIGEIVERAADHTIVTNAAIEQSIDYEPAHQMLDGFKEPGKAQLIPNRFKAIQWTLEQAQPGDAVLVAGCGERPFALVGEEHWTITDRDVCQAWLYDHASLIPDDKKPIGDIEIYNIDDFRD